MRRALPLLYLIWPAVLLAGAGDRALGRPSVDLGGHLWMAWSASRGQIPTTELLGWPEGVDLLPALGGWGDVVAGGLLAPVFGLTGAYNAVIALYLVVAGLGGAALARQLGAGAGGALCAGVLLQLDGFVALHLIGGRPEQVGLGFLALAMAMGIGCWRGSVAPWRAGLAGALLVYVSWELTLIGAGVAGALVLGLGRPKGGWRRPARAIGVAAVAAGPWIALFLARALVARSVDEGAFSLETALRASVGALAWFQPGRPGPSTAAMLCLLALPFTLRDRRLLAAIFGGAAAAWVLAWGPAPTLWGAPPGPPAPVDPGALWGPFRQLQSLPVLGWYHWPDRLLCSWSLAAAAAAGLVVSRAAAWTRIGAGLLASALIAGAAVELRQADRWPSADYALRAPPALSALAADPAEGAVLDLPMRPEAALHLDYQLLQIAHGRPIRYHMLPGHLTRDPSGGSSSGGVPFDDEPLISWFRGLLDPRPPAPRTFDEGDLAGLRARGFAFVALHQRGWPGDRWQMARDALTASLGQPTYREGNGWMCWRL